MPADSSALVVPPASDTVLRCKITRLRGKLPSYLVDLPDPRRVVMSREHAAELLNAAVDEIKERHRYTPFDCIPFSFGTDKQQGWLVKARPS